MKKKKLIIVSIIAVIIIIFILNQSGLINFSQYGFTITVQPSAGAQDIKNPSTGSNSWTYTDNSFVCDADECIVSGSMEVSKTASGELAGKYSCYGQEDAKVIFNDYETCYTARNSGIYQGVCNNGCRLDNAGKQCTNSNCKQISQVVYEGSFNFCPSTDPNFAFCKGTSNDVSSNVVKTYYTDEKKITKGARIDFYPKYSDGSSITKKAIQVRKYDLSCLPAIDRGDACSSNQIYCKPSYTCGSGYQFKSSALCNNQGTLTNICVKDLIYGTSVYNSCTPATKSYQTYNACDSNKTIGSSICNAFGNNLYFAPTGQECFLLDSQGRITSNQGEGVGGIACKSQIGSPNFCSLGSRDGTTGSTTYRECTRLGQCNQWTDLSCPTGLVYDNAQKDCILPPSTSCTVNSAQCVSSKLIRKCEQVTISGKVGYQWQQSQACPGELACETTNDGKSDNDLCSCKGVDEVNNGSIKCTTTTNFLTYSKDPTNPNSCLKYRDITPNTVSNPSIEECRNNEITQRSDIGCSFNTPGFTCSTVKDSQGISVEKCTNNQCTLTNDQYSATENQYVNGETRCSLATLNGVEKVEKIIDGAKSFYRWTKKTDEPNTVNGVCNSDYTCVKTGTKASCQPGFTFIGIVANNSYGVLVPINGVKVVLTNSYPGGKSNVQITARLLENGQEIAGTRKVVLTNSLGERVIDFDYAHPRTGQIEIEAIAGDPATSSYKSNKRITITKRLDLKLNCPTVGYVNRPVECTFRVEDLDTGTLIAGYQPRIQVLQGTREIVTDPLIDRVSFTTGTSGGVIVLVSASKDGYLSDSEQATVTVQVPDVKQSFLIDNQDYSVVGTTLSVGSHQLALAFDEVGTASDINSITAIIRDPSSREVPITLSQQAGKWVTNYNFQQAGSNYKLSGTVYFTDISKAPQPFEFTIITLGSKTESDKSTINLFIIGVIAGIAILVVLIVTIFFARRRKK